MSDRAAEERRQFYACHSCEVVYAALDAPDECAVCENDSFVPVMPREQEY